MQNEQTIIEKKLSPDRIRDYQDLGDEMQRNVRYQHGYGAILLIASARGDKQYRAIWCEHHDDYLCERTDNSFDAYQVKTRQPERGYWKMTDVEIKNSIKKFCNLRKLFGDNIKDFFFVSNAEASNTSPSIQDQNNLKRSPVQFLRAIAETETEKKIPKPFQETFQNLLEFCDGSSPNILFSVLKKLFIIKGPGRDSFDAEIVQKHLPTLNACANLPIPTLNKISEVIIEKIHSASARKIDDPNQHVFPLDLVSSENPIIKSKRISLELLDELILENISPKITTANSEIVCQGDELSEVRRTIFIYSAPADADFARWLSLQLINNGYQVWCDILDLDNSDEAEQKRHEVFMKDTCKFIFVLTDVTNQDSESLENLKIAYDLAQKEKYEKFIITVELKKLTSAKHIFLNSALSFEFFDGWAKGFHSLLNMLEKEQAPIDISSNPSLSNSLWRNQFNPERGVTPESEEYLSNWFKIDLPEQIYFHELQKSGIGSLTVSSNLPYPRLQHGKYLVAFTNANDFSGNIGDSNSIKHSNVMQLQDFLDKNYDHTLVSPQHTWNFVTDLLNQAWILHFETSNLKEYELANKRKCFYFHKKYGSGRIYFMGVNRQKTWRSLVGKKANNHWHFAIQGRANLHPYPHYLIKSHVLSSSDGYNIWKSDKQLHKARRSWFKNWWNAEWRDRLLAAMSFVSDSKDMLDIPVGSDVNIKVSTFPEMFTSPVSYTLISDSDEDIQEEDFFDDEFFDEEDSGEFNE